MTNDNLSSCSKDSAGISDTPPRARRSFSCAAKDSDPCQAIDLPNEAATNFVNAISSNSLSLVDVVSGVEIDSVTMLRTFDGLTALSLYGSVPSAVVTRLARDFWAAKPGGFVEDLQECVRCTGQSSLAAELECLKPATGYHPWLIILSGVVSKRP